MITFHPEVLNLMPEKEYTMDKITLYAAAMFICAVGESMVGAFMLYTILSNTRYF